MRSLVFALLTLAASFFVATSADARTLGMKAPEVCAGDGLSGALTGTTPGPSLLSGYAARSPCSVAGVDYPVGRPTSGRPALRDPAIFSFSAPLSYSAAQKSVRCDSGNDVVVEDFDFSLNNGIAFNNVSCTNVTVRYNKFGWGSNCTGGISSAAASVGMTVEYNTIDGGGGSAATSGCAYANMGETVTFAGNGGAKIYRYNLHQNVWQHFLTFQGSSGAAEVKYNYFSGCGFYQANHCNGAQIVGGVSDGSVFAYNTYVSEQPSIAIGPFTATFTSGSPTFTGATLGGEPGSANSLAVGMTITSAKFASGSATIVSSSTSGTLTSITASANATASGSDSFGISNAYPSGFVIPINWSTQLEGSAWNTQIYRNTIISPGPLKTVSYSIYCQREQTGASNTNAKIWGNYLDITGAIGAFFPSRMCDGVWGSPWANNINMSTGATLAAP